MLAHISVELAVFAAIGLGLAAGISTGLTKAHPASGMWVTMSLLLLASATFAGFSADRRDLAAIAYDIATPMIMALFVLGIPTTVAYFGGYVGASLLKEWLAKRRANAP